MCVCVSEEEGEGGLETSLAQKHQEHDEAPGKNYAPFASHSEHAHGIFRVADGSIVANHARCREGEFYRFVSCVRGGKIRIECEFGPQTCILLSAEPCRSVITVAHPLGVVQTAGKGEGKM